MEQVTPAVDAVPVLLTALSNCMGAPVDGAGVGFVMSVSLGSGGMERHYRTIWARIRHLQLVVVTRVSITLVRCRY
jgi:hypothetical protein